MAENNNILDQAVEQVSTEDSDASSEEQQQQSAANAAAAGTDSATDQNAGAEAPNEGASQDSSDSEEEAPAGGNTTPDTGVGTQNIDGASAQAVSGDTAPEDDGSQEQNTSGTGAQTVGGNETEGDDNSEDETGTSAGGANNTAAASGATPDTTTTSESFDFNTFNTPYTTGDNPLENGQEDFDSETVTTDVDVTVTSVNDAPEAENHAYTINEDGSITFTPEKLLTGASDIDNDNLSLTDVTYTGDDGVLTANVNGSYTFTPNENFNGNIALSYGVSDGNGGTTRADIALEITAVNDAPTAGNVTFNTDEDNVLTFTDTELLLNASDIEGDVTIEDVSYAGDDGVLVDNGDGTYSFTPNENFNGDVELSFSVSDQDGETVSATASIAVNPVNDAPEAEDDGVAPGNPMMIRMDTAPEYGDMQYRDENDAWQSMQTGTPYAADTDVRYTPDNAGGDVQIGSFGDTASLSDWGNVTGNKATLTKDGITIVTTAGRGKLAEWNDGGNIGNGIGDHKDEGLSGDDSLTMTLDGNDSGNITVTLDGMGGWFDESSSEATQVALEAFDEDGNVLETLGGYRPSDAYEHSYTFNNETPIHTVKISTDGGDGNFVVSNMTIHRNPSETVSLTTVQPDGTEIVNSTVVSSGDGTVVLTDALIAPEKISDDAIVVDEGGVLTLTPAELLGNDTDIDGDLLSITAVEATADTHGAVALDDDGNLVFTPDANYNGAASFAYTVTDEGGLSDTATVYVHVAAVNDAPEIAVKTVTTEEDGSIIITIEDFLAGASDIDGDMLTVSDVTYTGDDGVLTANDDGTFTFTPNENFSGLTGIDYKVSDGEITVDASLNIDVTNVNDAPEAPDIIMDGVEDNVLTIDPAFILAQASDADGDTLTLEKLSVRQPENATLIQSPDGSYQLAGAQDWHGAIALAYEISDGNVTTEGTITVNVAAVNDAPTTTANARMTILEDENVTFSEADITALFDDVDFDNLSISRIVNADNDDAGDITDNGDGTFTYIPANDYAGTQALQIIVSDPDGEEATLTMPVYIRPVADGAVITSENEGSLVFDEGGSGQLGLSVTLPDTSETLSHITLSGFPAGSTVSDGINTAIAGDAEQHIDITGWDIGAIGVTPPENYNGTFSVTVTATTVDYGDENSVDPLGIDPSDHAYFSSSAGEPLIITDAELLAIADNIDAEAGDNIRLVHLIDRSQGTLIDAGNDTYVFTPAPGFSGMVDFAFVIDHDGVSTDVQSTISVESLLPDNDDLPQTYVINEDGSVTINDLALRDDAVPPGADADEYILDAVAYTGDDGILTDNGNGSHTFWPSPDYAGTVSLNVMISDGETDITTAVEFNIPEDNDEVAPFLVPEDTDDSENYLAGPGDVIQITLPESVIGNDDTEYVTISNLPDGAEILGSIENGEGASVITGDLSAPISITLGDDFEGSATLQVAAYDDEDNAINGAEADITLTIDTDYTGESSAPEEASDTEGDDNNESEGAAGNGAFDNNDFNDLDVPDNDDNDDLAGALSAA